MLKTYKHNREQEFIRKVKILPLYSDSFKSNRGIKIGTFENDDDRTGVFIKTVLISETDLLYFMSYPDSFLLSNGVRKTILTPLPNESFRYIDHVEFRV